MVRGADAARAFELPATGFGVVVAAPVWLTRPMRIPCLVATLVLAAAVAACGDSDTGGAGATSGAGGASGSGGGGGNGGDGGPATTGTTLPGDGGGGDGGAPASTGACTDETSSASGSCQARYTCDGREIVIDCGEDDPEAGAECECLVDGAVVATCTTSVDGEGSDGEQCHAADNCCNALLGVE